MDVSAMGNPTAVPEYSRSLAVRGLRISPSSPRSKALRPVGFAFIERRSAPVEGPAAARHWLWGCSLTEILAFVAFEIAVRCVLTWRRHFRT
jgi:hypothetical protein